MNWDLTKIFSTYEEWSVAFKYVEENVDMFISYKTKLNDFDTFKEYYGKKKDFIKKLMKVYGYIALKKDMNQLDSKTRSDYMSVVKTLMKYNQNLAFEEPEVLQIGYDTVMKWCECEELAPAKNSFIDLFRLQKHVKSEIEEAIMSSYSPVVNNYDKLYDALVVSDKKVVEVTLSNGEVVKLNNANYRNYLTNLDNQEDRKKVFDAIFKYYADHKNTFASIYNGIVQTNIINCKNRSYDELLEAHLAGYNIPTSVYKSLIETASSNTAPVKKYYELRRKYFKLDKLRTYDRFLQFSKSDVEYTYEYSKELVLDACKSLGDDFYNKACKALEDGRVSVYSADGKASGAYSTKVYGSGTFILLNHNNDLMSAFTVAHECGHSIHSLYSMEAQPFETCNYSIFVAEVASTFNEQLFLDYLQKKGISKEEKLILLQQTIDEIISTFYRQALFAQYEYEAHKVVEDGGNITEDVLSNIMKKLYKQYYDLDIEEEEYKEYVWAYIPHLFHTPFYVYQYATSFSAACDIYSKVKNNEENALENYINLLKAGSSKYPVDIIKGASVDLTTNKPFIAVVDRLTELVDELEKVLNE